MMPCQPQPGSSALPTNHQQGSFTVAAPRPVSFRRAEKERGFWGPLVLRLRLDDGVRAWRRGPLVGTGWVGDEAKLKRRARRRCTMTGLDTLDAKIAMEEEKGLRRGDVSGSVGDASEAVGEKGSGSVNCFV